MRPERSVRFLDGFAAGRDRVLDLVRRSFLSAAARAEYEARFLDRLRALA